MLSGTGSAPGAQPLGATGAALPLGPMSMKQRLFRIVRAPMALVRRFLVGSVHLKLDALHERLDHITFRLDTLHPKSDMALSRMEVLGSLVRSQGDEAIRAVGAIQHTLDTRLHQLDIKVRGPLDYDADTRAVRTVDGYILVPKAAKELYILLADAPAEGLEPGTHRCLKALIDPGMTVIDVGANVGMMSLAFARSVGATGKVFAFEAEPQFHGLLAKTFALNGVPWVELRPQAAGRAKGRATFHVSPIAGHSSLYELEGDEGGQSRPITVDVVTLDEALAGAAAEVDLVKIDVEGAELDVLAGMTGLLARNPEIAVVAEFGPSHLARVGLTPRGWFEAFEAHGFAAYAIDEATGACRKVVARQVENVVSVNIVFARPGTKAAGRLDRLGHAS